MFSFLLLFIFNYFDFQHFWDGIMMLQGWGLRWTWCVFWCPWQLKFDLAKKAYLFRFSDEILIAISMIWIFLKVFWNFLSLFLRRNFGHH
jgi:hypothetical protein